MTIKFVKTSNQIAQENKTQILQLAKEKLSTYLCWVNIGSIDQIIFGVSTAPKKVEVTTSHLFGLVKRTHTEDREVGIAYFENLATDKGRAYLFGTKEQNDDVLEFLKILSKSWSTHRGNVDIEIEVTYGENPHPFLSI